MFLISIQSKTFCHAACSSVCHPVYLSIGLSVISANLSSARIFLLQFLLPVLSVAALPACLSVFHAAVLYVAILPTFIYACLACLKSKISYRAYFRAIKKGTFSNYFNKNFTSSERFCLFQISVVSKQNFSIFFTNVFENENQTLG